MDYDKFTEAITGLSESDIDFEVRGLDAVGKTKLQKEVVAPVPPNYPWKERHEVARQACEEVLDDGWIAPTYFGSRDSFFNKDGVEYCRGVAYKFVDQGEESK